MSERAPFKEKRWDIQALELIASLGDLHKELNRKLDLQVFLRSTRDCLKRLVNFKSLAFCSYEEKTNDFILSHCEPESQRDLIQSEIDHHLQLGTLDEALKENKVVIIDSESARWNPMIFMEMRTPSRVLGMFAGQIDENPSDLPVEQLNLISVVIQNVSYAIENAFLNDLTTRQNLELKKTVQNQNIDLKNQKFELKQLNEDRVQTRKALYRLAKQNESILKSASEGIAGLDTDGRITFVNTKVMEITGYSEDELVGQFIHERIHHSRSDGSPFNSKDCSFLKVLRDGQSRHIRDEILWKRDGSSFLATCTCSPMTEEGVLVGAVFTFQDTTSLKVLRDKIASMANYDSLTGLPNRNLINDRLNVALAHARRKNEMVAVLLLDMDNFKKVNESLGPDVGDLLLQSVANRLSSSLRKEDTVARLGGDEFIILLKGIHHQIDVSLLAKKIIQNLNTSFVIDNHEIFVNFSIGISLFPNDGEDSQTLLMNADTAMYWAKDSGKGTYQHFNPSMLSNTTNFMSVENGLRKALKDDEFVIHYQPKIDLETNSFVGMEALIRWYRPDIGLIPPGDFIPIAEESRLIIPMGEWVLRTACAQIKNWEKTGTRFSLAVNISGHQFGQSNLVKMVDDILRETGIQPGALELEITETVLMEYTQETISRLNQLKELGVKLAIDDFGTGYSSLNYLRQMPIDTLKIDRSFVNDLTSDTNIAISKAIVSLAKSLGLNTVAEGVETESQREMLHKIGCDQIQGFLVSKPIGVEEMTQKISLNSFGLS